MKIFRLGPIANLITTYWSFLLRMRLLLGSYFLLPFEPGPLTYDS